MGTYTVRRFLVSLAAIAEVTYKEWAAYRSHMLLSIVIGPVFFLVQWGIWNSVYQGHASLGGYDLAGMLRYYGTATLVYYVTMDFADWNLQMHVRQGSYLAFLLRPLPHWWFALSQKVGHRFLGFLFEFLPVWAILALGFGLVLLPVDPGCAVLSLLLGFLMMFFLNYGLGLLAFWFVRTDGLRSLFSLVRDFLAGALIPVSFFPDWLQQASPFLPFVYTSSVPIRVFQGDVSLVVWQGVAVVVAGSFTLGLTKLAERRFTGVGT